MQLAEIDFIVIAVPLCIVTVTSIYLQRYVKSVADFLAANRSAGRYLISTATAQTGTSVMALIVGLEVFSKVGWSLSFWGVFSNIAFLILGILGIVGYRFRQTRSLTFHQFFEVRYSKGVRVFASFLHAFSGVLTFGVQPAVGARFFLYFCGLPEQVSIAGWPVPTFIVLMIFLMGMSLYFALTGGQISVMVTDCLEGVISSFFYLVVAGFLVYTLSIQQVRSVMLSGSPGASYVDPFDIGSRSDFNGGYVFIVLVMNMYFYRGNAWNQGFAAAAKSPHEIRMAGIIGNWRGYSYSAMTALVGLGAFTLLHHPDFAAKRMVVEQTINSIARPELHSQMRMPIAIGQLLAPGVKGCFCAVLLFGLIAGQGQQLHEYGATFLQDVFLPFRKKHLSPKAHVRALRLTVFAVAAFACCFSVWFKPVDFLVLATALLGSLYMAGIGLVVWAGLYSKKGTTAGAWASLLIGASFSTLFFIFQQNWVYLQPKLLSLAGSGRIAQFLANNPEHCPLNGQKLSLITAVSSALAFILVSFMTYKKDFNLDAMLHRGQYRLGEDQVPAQTIKSKRSWLSRFLDINENFSRGDKLLTYGTFFWSMTFQTIAIILLCWTLLVHRLSPNAWFNYQLYLVVFVALVSATPTTLWFTWGVSRDLLELIQTLKIAKANKADDGTVKNHHNTGEADAATQLIPVLQEQ